jgi:hypothetical protein
VQITDFSILSHPVCPTLFVHLLLSLFLVANEKLVEQRPANSLVSAIYMEGGLMKGFKFFLSKEN